MIVSLALAISLQGSVVAAFGVDELAVDRPVSGALRWGALTIPARYIGALAQNIYNTYGKFPGTQPSVGIAAYTQAHHIDLDFYDTFYKEGAYLQTHAYHQRLWHDKERDV